MISFDLMQLSVSFCDELREQLSQKCRIQADAIITHCTHSHTAPSENDIRNFGISELINRLVSAIARARKSAKIATVSFAQIDTAGRFNVNRRKKLSAIDSTFTVWYGYDDNDGRPDGTWQVIKRLEMLTGRTIDTKDFGAPIIYDEQTDGLIQAIRFASETSGEPIGTIIRYSAHPCIAGHVHNRKYSADFPGIVRKIISKRLGGESCFMTGPCGNIAPWISDEWGEISLSKEEISLTPLWMPHKRDEDCWSAVSRLGRDIANEIISVADTMHFEKISTLKFVNKPIEISVRDDIMDDANKADELSKELYEEFLRARNSESIRELRNRADRINFLSSHKFFFKEYYYLNREQSKQRKLQIEMPVIRLDDIILIGFIGEVFYEVQQAARQASERDELRCFCFTEANGDIGYIPTSDEKINDDYECYCSVTAKGTLERLGEISSEAIGAIKE